ncbi:MAG: glutamate--tRNA ligase [Candidatus Micrarchaeota archaeon]
MKTSELILKHALKNALEHSGKAMAGAVLNRVIGEAPETKASMAKLGKEIGETLKRVNAMALEDIEAQILKNWPEMLEKRDEERRDLPELENAQKGKVVMRMAPNPDGAIHIGNARQAVLNWFYVSKYRGKYILRFDDTDPKVKKPLKEAYKWTIEDLKWLGIAPDEVLYASDRLDIYYEYAEKLLKQGNAYVCVCDTEEFRRLKEHGRQCPCRSLPSEEQLKRWQQMLSHSYKEGEAVYRVKTDLKDPNPALRDWPGLRIIDNPEHPRVKGKHVWPLLNFNSSIDDHLSGVTHIIRGRDLDFTEHQQRYLYKHFGWSYPHTVVTGKINVEEVVMSKTAIHNGIKNGAYTGWDDPKLGTIRALKKRGISAEGIKQLIWDLGVRKNNATVTWPNIEAADRKARKSPTFVE